jgi:hypothetical protein
MGCVRSGRMMGMMGDVAWVGIDGGTATVAK